MRFPYGTALLVVLVVTPYFFFSSNAFYLTNSFLNQYSVSSSNSIGLAIYVFLHVGLIHLITNLVSLVLFAFVLETILSSGLVVLVFLASGVVSGAVFSFINPASSLVGASAGIAGIMAAAAILRPKWSLILLLLTPLLISFVFLPLVASFSEQYEENLENKKTVLEKNVSRLIQEKKFAEAQEANKTLQEVSSTYSQLSEGRSREASSQTDFLVHAIGALVGILCVFSFARPALAQGIKEFRELGSSLHSLELRLKRKR